MRPTNFKVGNTITWSIRTYTDEGQLVDADGNPTVSVYKNGSSVADAVTVTKRAATTGIYDCSYNPAGEAEGDTYEITELILISTDPFENAWSIVAEAAERGTDGASMFDASTDTVTTDTASREASKADVDGLATESTAGQLETNQQGLMTVLTGTIIPNQSAISSRVVSIGIVTDKMDTMVQADGVNWQYTVDSLALAPTGSGGGGGDSAATIYAYFTDSNREDAFKADVDGLSTLTTSDILVQTGTALVDYNTAKTSDVTASTNTVTNAINNITVNAPTEAEMYAYFAAGSRPDVFRADVGDLALESTLNDGVNQIITTGNANWVTGSGSGGGSTPEQIFDYFNVQDLSNFRADVAGLALETTLNAGVNQIIVTGNANWVTGSGGSGGGGGTITVKATPTPMAF